MATLAHPAWCRQDHCYPGLPRHRRHHGRRRAGRRTVDVHLAGEPNRPMVMLALVEDLAARLTPADAYHLAALLTRYGRRRRRLRGPV